MSEPHYADDLVTLHHGDCLDVLREMPEASVDAVVTDPPYGLEFMGKDWDGADGFRRSLNPTDAGRDNAFGRTSRTSPEYRPGRLFGDWCEAWAAECLRVLKPGGHLLAFGGTRTWHRLACAIEDAGFEVRDSIAWLYGSGFPKSLDVAKAIDKAAGVAFMNAEGRGGYNVTKNRLDRVGESTPEAEKWQGWGTALKPAHEPIVVARKPLAGTVASNVLAHGTGALNIDACRIGQPDGFGGGFVDGYEGDGFVASTQGRWPANVALDESQAAELDRQSGTSVSNVRKPSGKDTRGVPNTESQMVMRHPDTRERGVVDTGGASRFFYVAKAPKKERPQVDGVAHPTVKPLALMRWLVRLVTPPGGVVLDPFAGSGTTVEAAVTEGLHCVAIEREDDYLPLIQARLDRVAQMLPTDKEAS